MMRRPLALVAMLGVVAALGVAAGCGDDDDSGDVATVAPEEVGDVAAGKVVFAENCTSCHLGDGTEGGGAGPDLSGKGSDHTPEQLRAVVVEGRGTMPPGLVTGTDLDNVVAYVYSLK